MKLIKKFKWFIVAFFVLLLILIALICKDLLFASEGVLYGNRLVGIEDVPITDDVKSEIKTLFSSTAGVTKVNTNVHGKIFNIVVYVDETVTLDTVKAVSNEALTKCSDKQKAFYDISFLIDYANDSTKTDFPIIGYKNKNSEFIIW
ncbi:MAG: hypothetical protein WC343_02655 [Bacilli bacterium]|jgi:hypothetical protein